MSFGGRPPPAIERMVSLKVDNITYRTRPEDMRRVFEKYGEIGDIYIPRDRYNKESRGFAFVRFYDRRDAEDAMDAMDGRMYDGRELRVQMARYARPMTPPDRRYGGGRYGGGGGGGGRRGRSRSRSRSRDRRSRSRSRGRRSRSRSRSRDRRTRSRTRSRSRSHSRSARDSKSPDRRKAPEEHEGGVEAPQDNGAEVDQRASGGDQRGGSRSRSRSRSGSRGGSRSRSRSRE